jgi:hypothetical protein
MTTPSSFLIPFVFENHDAVFIRKVFHELRIGMVDRVDYIPLKNNDNIKAAFVHLKYWYHTDNADQMFNGIENGNEITIILNKFDNTNRYWLIKKMLCPKKSNREMKTNPNTYKLYSLTKLHDTIDELHDEVDNLYIEIETSNNTIAKLERCISCVVNNKIGVIHPNDNRPLTDLDRLLQTDNQINYDNTHRQNSHKRFM